MKPDNLAAPTDAMPAKPERLFTVQSASDTLVFVRRVVRDIVQQYDLLMKLRAQREELAISISGGEKLEEVRRRIEDASDKLRELHDELADVGCELKDWVTGLVDFPALHEGRKVCLCWKLDEPGVSHWHEWFAGFSGRQPIGPDFGAAAPGEIAIQPRA